MLVRLQPLAAALLVAALPHIGSAQETTKDGIRIENSVNRPERPYRQAGSSDPRDAGPHVARGFGKVQRRLVYVSLPGGSAGGQFYPSKTASASWCWTSTGTLIS